MEGDDYSGLYRDVLIDTPIGPYFMKFLEQSIVHSEERNLNDIQVFKDMKPEEIRTTLKKMWLEDFYYFCDKELSGVSREMMLELLNIEADFKTIQVIYNSIGNKEYNTALKMNEIRTKLCPCIGNLYPDIQKNMISVANIENLRESLKSNNLYREMMKNAPDPLKREEFSVSTQSLDDIMYDEETRQYALAFESQA